MRRSFAPQEAAAAGGIGQSHSRPADFASQGMRITFKNLAHTVPSNTEPGVLAHLLKYVSGFFQPAEMTALMGPSGSGKTTLLDILSGRKTAGKTMGTISFSGSTPSRAFLRRYTGYVEQFDTLIGLLTVREMLLYTSELKRPMSEPLSSKEAAVDDLLQKLALVPCKDVKIGSRDNKGISGGQAKRVNIGIALVSNPRVLFLDEPTTGLDSFTANEVVSVLKALCRGRDAVTVTATIHSPTQYAFELFDALMVLVRGRMVYFGRRSEAVPYALHHWKSKLPGGGAVTVIRNEAEWLVDVVTAADRAGTSTYFADEYGASPMKVAVNAQIADFLQNDHAELGAEMRTELATQSATVTPWWFGLKTLVKYRTPKNYKDPEFVGARVGEQVINSTLMWSLYWGVGSNTDPGNMVNISAVLFMWCILPAYGAASYVPAIVLERALYVRERADGLYLPITYLLAKMVDELMIAFVTSVWISAAAFYAIEFQGSFLLFWLVYIVTLMIGVVLAYFIAAASPNIDVANAVLPTYVTMLLFFGGFLMNFESIPQWWKWFSYVDFVRCAVLAYIAPPHPPRRYGWGALMVNQFSGTDPIWQDGKTVLESYGLKNYGGDSYELAGPAGRSHFGWYKKDVDPYDNVGFMLLFFLSYLGLAWYTLATKDYQQR